MHRSLHWFLTLSLIPLAVHCSSSGPSNDQQVNTVAAGGTPAATGTAGNSGVAVSMSGSAGAGDAMLGGGGTTTATAGAAGSGGQAVTMMGGSGGGAAIGGAGGDTGAGGSGTTIMGPTPTSGCNAADPGEQPQTWLENDITVADLPADQVDHFGQRRYWVRLPNGYDHSQMYPVVFYGPGCGASNVEGTPMMNSIADVAIHVFLLQQDSCFSTGGYPSPEVPYFNQALDEVQAKYCTDASKVFVSGYSSGGWLSNVLACADHDRIRATGTAAGGISQSIVDGYGCPGGPAGIFYTGENDTANPADNVVDGFQKGVIGARDYLINGNGCDPNASEPWVTATGADFCDIWKTGCEDSPVIYCVGPGDGHGNGSNGNISTQGFWEFWSSLP